MSVFIDTPTVPPSIEIKLFADFQRDSHPDKVYLAGREWLGEDGQVAVPPLIRRMKQQMTSDPTLSPEYPPRLGLPAFNRGATELALGKDSSAIVQNRVLGVQTVGGAGALRLGAELLRCRGNGGSLWAGAILLSRPCDESLARTFEAVGLRDIRWYRYWDMDRRGVWLEGMLEDLEDAPEGSVVILSASGQSPTGAHLTQEEWRQVVELIQRRGLLPWFLLGCQGLCSADLEQDSWPLRHCVAQGLELLCAQSFSHSFSLYGERVGHLLCVLKENSALLAVQSQAQKLVQTLWSCPPMDGARLVAMVLSNPANLAEWMDSVRARVERCMLVRERLREKLRLLGSLGSWDHLVTRGGLFCCVGLNDQQVDFLAKRRHVYLLPDGCLNISAINSQNLEYVAQSIHLALTSDL